MYRMMNLKKTGKIVFIVPFGRQNISILLKLGTWGFAPLHMSCRRHVGKAFHTRRPATEKLLSPKLLCVWYVRRGPKARTASVGNKLMSEATYAGVCPAQRLMH